MEGHIETKLILPKPKFCTGDVIEIKNDHNDKSIFVHIIGVRFNGSWSITNGEPLAYMVDGFYNTTVQPGSYYDNENIGLMRPGKNLVFSYYSLEQHVKVLWDDPVISSDTLENLRGREEKWDGGGWGGMSRGSNE